MLNRIYYTGERYAIMSYLIIETNWRPTEICINIIPVELKTELELRRMQIKKEMEFEIVAGDRFDVTLEHAWYGFNNGIVAIDEYWAKGVNSKKYIGPTFLSKTDVLNVLSNKHKVKKLGIFVDGIEIDYVSFLITCNFQEVVNPKLKRNELAVHHGGVLDSNIEYGTDIVEPFEENRLVFNFIKFDGHDYILKSATYDNAEMEVQYDAFSKNPFDLKFIN